MSREERERLAQIKAKWESFKAGDDGLSGPAFATAIAMWASLNVDYLIRLAERGEQP